MITPTRFFRKYWQKLLVVVLVAVTLGFVIWQAPLAYQRFRDITQVRLQVFTEATTKTYSSSEPPSR